MWAHVTLKLFSPFGAPTKLYLIKGDTAMEWNAQYRNVANGGKYNNNTSHTIFR